MKKRMDLSYGTAKITNNPTDKATNVERNKQNALPRTQQACAFDARVSICFLAYRTRLCDTDGACLKYTIDGLVHANIIRDDSAKYVESVSYRQVKVKTKSEEKTEIIIEVVG